MPDLQPGPELDARIAAEIMGSRIRLTAGTFFNGHVWHAAREFPAGATKERDVPYYSTDIGAAWLIVERLRAAGIEVIIGCFKNSFSIELMQWRDRRAEGIPGDPHTGRSRVTFCLLVAHDLLPLAVCDAALRPETLAALKVEQAA